MKKLIYIIFFLLYTIQLTHALAINDTVIEKFDSKLLGKENGIIIKKENGQFVFIQNLEYDEYPLEKSYYYLQKLFYPNGNLKSKGKLIPHDVKIGIWQYYNEDGSFDKEVNEDESYGKVKYQDIQKFAQAIRPDSTLDYYYNIIIEDDPGYYYEKYSKANFGYNEQGKGNVWTLRIFTQKGGPTTYDIDGDTGDLLDKEMLIKTYEACDTKEQQMTIIHRRKVKVGLNNNEPQNIYDVIDRDTAP